MTNKFDNNLIRMRDVDLKWLQRLIAKINQVPGCLAMQAAGHHGSLKYIKPIKFGVQEPQQEPATNVWTILRQVNAKGDVVSSWMKSLLLADGRGRRLL